MYKQECIPVGCVLIYSGGLGLPHQQGWGSCSGVLSMLLCIPAAVAVWGVPASAGVSPRHSPGQTPMMREQAPPPTTGSRHPSGTRHQPGTRHPPGDRHTPVNILPCPKLRLRAAITSFLYQFLRVSLLVEMYDNQYGLLTSSSTLIDPNRYQHCYHPPTK